MTPFLFFLFLIGLFYLLGKAADMVVVNTRQLGHTLRVPIFFLGLVLGVLTSLPEFAIGLQTVPHGLGTVTFGNLMGGIVVLMGLILGLRVILNRRIKVDHHLSHVFAIFGLLLFPLFLGFKGRIDAGDGMLLIGLCLVLFYLLALWQKRETSAHEHALVHPRAAISQIFFIFIGLVGVVVLSRGVLWTSVRLLEHYPIPAFLLGFFLFSLGTNLPEIMVTLRSYRYHIRELSVSNLLGSAITNVLLIGVFALVKPFSFEIDMAYVMLFFGMGLLFIFLAMFYRTQGALTRQEGWALISFAVLIMLSQFIFGSFLLL